MARKPAKKIAAANKPPVATMVSGVGSDDEIAARCAAEVEGWDKLGDKSKADMVRLMRHFDSCRSIPAMEVVKGAGGLELQTPDKLNPTLNAMRLIDAMGVSSDAFLNDRIKNLAVYHSGNTPDGLTTQGLSGAFAMIAGGNATDPVQSAILTQMHCVNDAAFRALGQVGKSSHIPQAQMWGNLATKLLNTFARQAEVLAKLQRGGEQVIKHIHIDNRGGQAVLAEQLVTGGVGAKSEVQGHRLDEAGPALLGSDAFGRVVPMPSREGAEAVPVTRLRPR